MQVRARQSGFVRTEGGLLPADLLERVRALDPKVLGSNAEASYGLDRGDRFGEATTRAWNRLVGAWTALQVGLAQLPETDPATTTTRERFLLPLMEELGYGRLTPTKAIELDGKSYPISHGWGDAVPLHLVGANVPLDRRTQRVAGAAGQSPHGLLQELLNRSPERLWGIVSNARTLRILRDNASLTRQAYVEFDLEAIFEGESYADFALLWHLAHRTRLEPRLADGAEERSSPSVHGCYLEHWSKIAEETGARARDRLRDGVGEAIEALGSGFLRHPANTELKAALQSGDLATQDYYRELLRLVYRFILLFVAEDRDLLLDPTADPATRDRYARYYSTARLRHLAERRKGSRHADLYAGLRVVVEALGRDEGAPGIGLPPLGGFLFGPEACPHLDAAQLANADLLDAIRKLATIEEKGVLRSVDYRNLASEELGSIYESLLERHPEIDTPTGSFALKVAAGHERKTTGSYYTPSSLISVLLDSALDPVLEEKVAGATTKEDQEQAILDMSVVDPAAGSGHFLVAAAHRIAKRLAQVRTGDEEPAPDAVRTALRDVIGHCLYAVDINPMAVELCKVSLWLEALEPGKPLTFLDAHIKCGNSLLGTTPELIAQGIPDAAYDPIEGDDPVVAKALKKRNKAEREGQLSLGEAGLELPIAALAEAMREVDALPDDTVEELARKAHRASTFAGSTEFSTARSIADTWCAAAVQAKTKDAPAITTATVRSMVHLRGSDADTPAASLANSFRFFHWQLEFPDVFSQRDGRSTGFDSVIGNPPFVNAIEGGTGRRPKHLMRLLTPELGSTADLAYHFLCSSARNVATNGRLAFIQPRAVLTADSMKAFRAAPPHGLHPSLIYAPNSADFFPGAAVFICALGLARGRLARVSTDLVPELAAWELIEVTGDNWWRAIVGEEPLVGADSMSKLADSFDVYASMYIQEAYEAAGLVVDSPDDVGPKLVTTGLIDPGVCHWGVNPCRYLKVIYQRPRVRTEGHEISKSLARRLAMSRRPKILVAGLGKRVECFVDDAGEFIGVVSTYTILDRDDDVERLRRLAAWLSSDAVTARFRSELGGNAMGGGSATMRRDFLADLPLPA